MSYVVLYIFEGAGKKPAFRTGLTKVGMPNAKVGIQKEDLTIAEILTSLATPLDSSGRTLQ
jgi:hypothetical protein